MSASNTETVVQQGEVVESETIPQQEEKSPVAINQHLPAVSSTPERLLEIAISKDLDITKLEKLMLMQEKWQKEQARQAYYAALAKFQSLCPIIPKNKKAKFKHKTGTGYTEYGFATIDKIVECIKESLEVCGLSYRWMQDDTEALIKVTCTVTHALGHHESATLQGPADNSGSKNIIQQRASTISYLRRYTLTGLLGIATADVDDDGNAPEQLKPAERPLTNAQIKTLQEAMEMAGVTDEEVCKKAQIARIEELQQGRLQGMLALLKKYAQGDQSANS